MQAYGGKVVQRLNPILQVEGGDYLMMAHELAGVPLSVLYKEVCRLDKQRGTIKAALDFMLDGF